MFIEVVVLPTPPFWFAIDITFKKLEEKALNENIDYEELKGLSLEARQKLNKFKPTSVGQASRISGVSPADISVLLIYLEQRKKREKNDKTLFDLLLILLFPLYTSF